MRQTESSALVGPACRWAVSMLERFAGGGGKYAVSQEAADLTFAPHRVPMYNYIVPKESTYIITYTLVDKVATRDKEKKIKH